MVVADDHIFLQGSDGRGLRMKKFNPLSTLLNEAIGERCLTPDLRITQVILSLNPNLKLREMLKKCEIPPNGKLLDCDCSNAAINGGDVICIDPVQLRTAFMYLEKLIIYGGKFPIVFREQYCARKKGFCFDDINILKGTYCISYTCMIDTVYVTVAYGRNDGMDDLCNMRDFNVELPHVMHLSSSLHNPNFLFWDPFSKNNFSLPATGRANEDGGITSEEN